MLLSPRDATQYSPHDTTTPDINTIYEKCSQSLRLITKVICYIEYQNKKTHWIKNPADCVNFALKILNYLSSN
jgi:hypothetical protein